MSKKYESIKDVAQFKLSDLIIGLIKIQALEGDIDVMLWDDFEYLCFFDFEYLFSKDHNLDAIMFGGYYLREDKSANIDTLMDRDGKKQTVHGMSQSTISMMVTELYDKMTRLGGDQPLLLYDDDCYVRFNSFDDFCKVSEIDGMKVVLIGGFNMNGIEYINMKTLTVKIIEEI